MVEILVPVAAAPSNGGGGIFSGSKKRVILFPLHKPGALPVRVYD